MPCNYKRDYPPDWLTKIRPDILQRANNCCEFCGVKNNRLIRRFGSAINEWEYWPDGMMSESYTEDGYKAIKIILTIMHLDHDTKNNDYSNLKAGCQKCHNYYDRTNRSKNARQTLVIKKKLQSLF